MDSTSIHPGSAIGPYAVQESLGAGPLGPTFHAYDSRLNRSVAAKALEGLPPVTRERFPGVVERLLAIRHPNLLEVLDAGEQDGIPYVVTADVPGGSLAEALQGQMLNREASVRVLAGTAAGIDHLHAQGMVHGDLKPTNVLLGSGGHAFVGGFGIAPLLPPPPAPGTYEAGSLNTASVGSPAYMSPEQASHGELTSAGDRYVFAVMAFELLAGSQPFVGPPGAVLNAHVSAVPPAASQRDPSLGPATDAVLARGLAKGPAQRWQTCTQMVAALEQALAEDQERRLAPEQRRRWPLALGIVGALVLLAALAGYLIWRANQPSYGVTLSASTVQAGGSLGVSGGRLPAFQTGTVELHSNAVSIGAFQADRNGDMTTTVTIPANTSTGDHLVALCWSGGCPASAKVAVTATPPSPTPTPTPKPTPTPTPTPTPVPTATVTVTVTATATVTVTATPAPTGTPS